MRPFLFLGTRAEDEVAALRAEAEQECARKAEAAAVLGRQLQERERDLAATRDDLEQREKALAEAARELARQRSALESRGADLDRQKQDLARLREELTEGRKQLHERYRQRRDRTVEGLSAIPGLSCRVPEGAFYLYVNCGGILGRTTPDGKRLETDNDVVLYLLERAGVAVVAGEAYGLSPYFRLSIATSIETLDDGVARIARAVAELR